MARKVECDRCGKQEDQPTNPTMKVPMGWEQWAPVILDAGSDTYAILRAPKDFCKSCLRTINAVMARQPEES